MLRNLGLINNNMKTKHFLLVVALLLAGLQTTTAQCKYRNTAVKPGEFLSYNLYFNWQFVWVKAGTASMSVVKSNYKGQPALRMALITRTSETLDKMFVMRDTLLCYNTLDLEPLYYRKGAREGKRYTVDEAFYAYHNNKQHIKLHRQKNSGEHVWKEFNRTACAYDMMSIFLRARSFKPEHWKKGNRINIPITDGAKIINATLEYKGKTTVKGDNGVKYRCLQLSYIEKDENKNKEKEIVRFYVTDDAHHIPVRLDMFLKLGVAKAFLSGTKGVK